jgi:rubrerythrin
MAASSIEEIINFAVDKEREAITFYEDMAKKADDPVVKDAVLSMADEERKHERILLDLTPKKIQLDRGSPEEDLKLSDYLVDMTFSKDSTYQELLIIAMKREEKSFAFYADLEQRAGDEASRKVFTLLKGEELKHKARLEKEYEKYVLWED